MVVHWWREGKMSKRQFKLRDARQAPEVGGNHTGENICRQWIGALATFVVLMIFIVTKFVHGAWIVVVLIPALVLMFLKIHRHYVDVAQQLSTEGLQGLRPIHHEVIVPISGIHRGVIAALEYAKSIARTM
jgi:hypothetical protein